MNKRLEVLLEKYKPSKRGIHSTANCYESAEYYQRQFEEWQQCGFSWLKLLVASDSGVNTVRQMCQQVPHIIPVIRFYFGDNRVPHTTLAPDQIKPYLDTWGDIMIFECINEPNNEWAGQMPPNWPDLLANNWAGMAQSILNAGGIPLLPSIEGWSYEKIFVPLWHVLIGKYRGIVEQSIINIHNRTLNHPVNYAQDSGGYLGWTWFDKLVRDTLGYSLPIMATEAGAEPGWDQDNRYPVVTPETHRDMCLEIEQAVTPPYYLANMYWLWEGSGGFARASWKRNREYGGRDLPVVEAFKQQIILPPIEPPEPPVEPPSPPADTTITKLQAWKTEIDISFEELLKSV